MVDYVFVVTVLSVGRYGMEQQVAEMDALQAIFSAEFQLLTLPDVRKYISSSLLIKRILTVRRDSTFTCAEAHCDRKRGR